MVDTMLACDLLSAASQTEVVAVGVIAEDTDLLPALVQSRAQTQALDRPLHIALILPRDSNDFEYPHVDDLVAMNIHVLNRQGEHFAS